MILNHSHLLVLGSVVLCPTASLSQGYGVQVCAPALGMPPRIQAQGVGCSPPSSPSPWLCPQPPSARWQPRTLTSASNCSAPGLILAHQTVIIGASQALTSLQLVSMAPVSAELQTAHRERGRGAPSSAVGRATGPPPHQHLPSSQAVLRGCSWGLRVLSSGWGRGTCPLPRAAGSLHPRLAAMDCIQTTASGFCTLPAQAKQGWRGSTQACSCCPRALLMQGAEQ